MYPPPSDKLQIITRFCQYVKNQPIDTSDQNIKHCGKTGYWLETKMQISHNGKNEPDLFGYEMKTHNDRRITIGDFSASEYAFSTKNKRNFINKANKWTDDIHITKIDFMKFFGHSPNDRYSWSGVCVPKYNTRNTHGQILIVLPNNDIAIYYSYAHDTRADKSFIPEFLQTGHILIAIWKNEKMRQHIEKKFNNKGFFICKKNKQTNQYTSICFGKPFDFEYFIVCIKNRKIIFDSGMHCGNSRNYSQFRGSPNFWEELIIEVY
jgi:hypothetical protein